MAGILTDIFVWSLKIWKSTRSLILCAHLFLLRLSWPGVMPKQRETFQVNWTLLKIFNDAHCQTKKKKNFSTQTRSPTNNSHSLSFKGILNVNL